MSFFGFKKKIPVYSEVALAQRKKFAFKPTMVKQANNEIISISIFLRAKLGKK